VTGAGSLRVLIVDDDGDHVKALRRLLELEGIDEVLEAADGDRGLEVALAERPDLVVLDLGMPDRSGVEVLPEMHDGLPDTRIVVLSNFSRRRMGEIVARRGAVGYVEKRVPAERLVRELLIAASLADHASARMTSRFPATAASAGKARRFVRRSLDTSAEQVLDDIELMVSELVTNAVLHATSPPRVDIVLGRTAFRIEIYDDDPTLPELGDAPLDALGGRGIFLVDRLASRWGTEPHGHGKVVWFERDRVPAPA
jgi:DNA-binding NarL/FixJ family response regulator